MRERAPGGVVQQEKSTTFLKRQACQVRLLTTIIPNLPRSASTELSTSPHEGISQTSAHVPNHR